MGSLILIRWMLVLPILRYIPMLAHAPTMSWECSCAVFLLQHAGIMLETHQVVFYIILQHNIVDAETNGFAIPHVFKISILPALKHISHTST